MEQHSLGGLGTSRWLEAVWEPAARIHTLPGGLDMLDVSGEGKTRLVSTDFGSDGSDVPKIRVYKSSDQMTEHTLTALPCGIVGFHSENGEPRSAALAVGAGSSVFIYKNMRPYFKYCLPHLDAHPKEREIWHKIGLEEEPNVLTLSDDLELLLKEIGAAFLSPRSLKFLSMDANSRASFAEQYRRVPLVKANAVSSITAVRKDSWNDPASSYIVVGTEATEILVLDPKAFSIVDKHFLGWVPVSLTSVGLWTGDGQVVAVGKNGQLGAVRRGNPIKLWENLPSPVVAVTSLANEGTALALMNKTLLGFSKKGLKLWQVQLPGIPLDLTNLSVAHTGLSLLAVSVIGHGVRVYDGRHHVDTIKVIEPVSTMKFGRMDQEERALAMITIGGGLSVKILKRTADFNFSMSTNTWLSGTGCLGRFTIPKKTRLFVEQTIQERHEATNIYNTFQSGFLRLRLHVAKKASETFTSVGFNPDYHVTMDSSLLGLGPNYVISVVFRSASKANAPEAGLFMVCREENASVTPRVLDLPLLSSGIPVTVMLDARSTGKTMGKIRILLCKKNQSIPLVTNVVTLPPLEDEQFV